jgi:hypothetical protein
MTDALLIIALGLAGLIFWRLHQARISPPSDPASQPGAPPGAAVLALGQYAVAPSRQWLLIAPGG